MHEGTPILLRRILGRAKAPKWFDEGLATFFQFWDLRGTTKDNLKNRYSRSVYRTHLRESYRVSPLPLNKLLTIEKWNPEVMGPHAEQHYAYAESLLDFLLTAKEARIFYSRIFKRLREGDPPVDENELSSQDFLWYRHIKRIVGLNRKKL
jgi:hypothetical protein